MSIHFQCPSCQQPIEVDDEWAGKLVACPYCRNTVTAASASTLGEVRVEPLARPLMAPAPGPDPPAPAALPARNRLGVVALVLAILGFSCMLGARASMAPHLSEMLEIAKPGASFAESQQAMLDYFEAQGGIPGWLVSFYLFLGVGGLIWLAAVICGILAVRNPFRRGLAVASLIVCGISPPVLCCLGG